MDTKIILVFFALGVSLVGAHIAINANPDLFAPFFDYFFEKREVKVETSFTESELTPGEYETLMDSYISHGVVLKK